MTEIDRGHAQDIDQNLNRDRAFSRRRFFGVIAVAAVGAYELAHNPIKVFADQRRVSDPEESLRTTTPTEALAADTTVYNPGDVVKRGDHTIPNVYLTFDDDWRDVAQVVDIANQKHAQITFCPVGQAVNKNKSLWQDVLLQGYTVENHTWNHKDLNKLTPDKIRDEITRQRDLVEEIAAQAGVVDSKGNPYKEVFLRPPYGHANPTVQGVAKELGLVIVRWCVSSVGDNKKTTEDKVYHNVVDHLKNGAIVLQHVGTETKDLDVLPRVIDEARRQGFSVNTSLRDGIKTSVYP